MIGLCGACGGILEQFFTQIIALVASLPAIRIALTSFKARFTK